MSDERFYLGNNGTTICDRSQGGSDGFNMLTIFKVVDLLNELVKDNEELGISIKLFEDDIATKDKKIDEQQSTINKLQEELELTAKNKLFSRRKLEEENKQLKKENEKLGNIHLSIDLTYSCGYGRYLADVRVVDDE